MYVNYFVRKKRVFIGKDVFESGYCVTCRALKRKR